MRATNSVRRCSMTNMDPALELVVRDFHHLSRVVHVPGTYRPWSPRRRSDITLAALPARCQVRAENNPPRTKRAASTLIVLVSVIPWPRRSAMTASARSRWVRGRPRPPADSGRTTRNLPSRTILDGDNDRGGRDDDAGIGAWAATWLSHTGQLPTSDIA